VFTTEQCVLNPNRNPGATRADVEAVLRDALGADTIVWLPFGLDDRDTDGHVDTVLACPAPGRVLLQGCDDSRNPEHRRAAVNRDVLLDLGFSVLELPVLPYVDVDAQHLPVPYANLVPVNDAVIVPVTGDAADDDTLARIGDAYPEREVVPVDGTLLAYGGGGPHCITQPVPVACW